MTNTYSSDFGLVLFIFSRPEKDNALYRGFCHSRSGRPPSPPVLFDPFPGLRSWDDLYHHHTHTGRATGLHQVRPFPTNRIFS